MATAAAIASLVTAAVSTYSAVESHNEANKQEKKQKEALIMQEEEALKKGPEAVSVSEEDADVAEARKRLLRKGFLSTLKTGETGLGSAAATSSSGLKGTLG